MIAQANVKNGVIAASLNPIDLIGRNESCVRSAADKKATLVPTSHPVVDIVRFQRLTVDLAETRGVDPDLIRWDEEPWDRARKAQDFTADL